MGLGVLQLLRHKGVMGWALELLQHLPQTLAFYFDLPFPVSLSPKESREVPQASRAPRDPVGSRQRD